MNTKPSIPAIEKVLNKWEHDPEITQNITYSHIQENKEAQFSEFPKQLDPGLLSAFQKNGIEKLYTHQSVSFDKANDKKNIIIVTGTSSGKTICYNLPVLNFLITHPDASALYLFPTKALTQDQFKSLASLIELIPEYTKSGENRIKAAIYDGDTPTSHRSGIRNYARILLSNPDMIHLAILPHHTIWNKFLQNLRFIIIDEIHMYRGVFGSHIANLIRRLKRILHFYGSSPSYILTSATIGNPVDFAEKFIEEKVELIDEDGSPKGIRRFILYNPPIINRELGIRRTDYAESVRLADDLLMYKVQILIFARTRRMVELLLINLRQKCQETAKNIRGYRSGYLPKERREIEQAFRDGRVRAVIATNALELGIDIGGVDAVIMSGYPGSIAGTWQQAGRAGRRQGSAVAIMVASGGPLDQYLIKNPSYLFEKSPERALIDPDNLLIAIQHIQCSIFELPFSDDESFGRLPNEILHQVLELLAENGVIHPVSHKNYWSADEYPAKKISLRNASADRILIRVESGGRVETIGEVDRTSAYWMLHPQAIYIHDGNTYKVEELLLDDNVANLIKIDPDYYTIPKNETQINKLNIYQTETVRGGEKYFGEVMLITRVTGYKEIRWFTHEKLCDHSLSMPQTQLRTAAYWFCIDDRVVETLSNAGYWTNNPIEYGPNWNKLRNLIRQRDHYTCRNCGQLEQNTPFHVHHKIPFRLFDTLDKANRIDNLVTLCPACHRKAEVVVRMQSGLAGVAYVLTYLAPLFLMCNFSDIGVYADPISPLGGGKPTLVFYDQTPGGIGLSQSLFHIHEEVLLSAHNQIQDCPCKDGCPSCVGPTGESGTGGKQEALSLLSILCSKT